MSANPMGAQPRPINPGSPIDYMSMKAYSGFVREVGPGALVEVFSVNLAELVPNGYAGMATIHVAVSDVHLASALPFGVPAANAVLMGTLGWTSGLASGVEDIDMTRGHQVQVGGTSCINLVCRLISSIEGEVVAPWATKRVEATINWFGAATKPGTVSVPMVTLEAEGTSAFQPIPRQARDHMVVTDASSAADLDTLVAEFSTSDDPTGAAIKYRTWNPFANGTPIVLGVEFVRYQSAAAMRVGSVYDLW